MKKPSNNSGKIIGFTLVLIALVSVALVFSGNFKAQLLLETPETLSPVKLLRQDTNPVQFDIYYRDLRAGEPKDISLVFINGILQEGKNFKNVHQGFTQVVLNTGKAEITTSTTNQTLTIRGLNTLNTTRLGSIVTSFTPQEYVSLEYDVIIDRKRVTQFDNPVPTDFPLGYETFQNPTSELLYISTPGFHTILSDLEKAYVKNSSVKHGALLLPNLLTTLQDLENLNSNTLVSQPLSIVPPTLLIEQLQVVLPELREGNLNTLIIRYRTGTNPWNYKTFLLSAIKDITLPVPLEHMLDIYTDVEYSFAYLSDAGSTVDSRFPYHSLLSDGIVPAFYRTEYASLLPELFALSSRTVLDLQVSIAPQPDHLAIGLLAREQMGSLPEIMKKLEQKLPIILFEEGNESFQTTVTKADQLPYFHLIGKNDQIWSQRVLKPIISLASSNFQLIPLLRDADQLPELEAVRQNNGDRLLCFIKTEQGSFSLATISEDLMLTSACLQSARRSGFQEGHIYPIVYKAKEQQLKALKDYEFESTLSSQVPLIKNYDPVKKTVSLNNVFSRETVRLMVSPSPDFDPFTTQPVSLINRNSFTLPVFGGCDTSCYFKVLSIIREDEENVLGFASETLFFATNPLPVAQFCVMNHEQIEGLYDPEELNFSIMDQDGKEQKMNYKVNNHCYEIVVGEEEIPEEPLSPSSTSTSTTGIRTAHAQSSSIVAPSFDRLLSTAPEFRSRTILMQTSGFASNHILIPAQQHALVLRTDSIHQVLMTDLVFAHEHLEAAGYEERRFALQKSYQINALGNNVEIYARNRGNALLHRMNDAPSFLELLNVSPVLNETILFPGGDSVLSVPNTIRLLNTDEVVLQSFDPHSKTITLNLPIPDQSSIRMILENVFRPQIQFKQILNEGITYDTENNLLTASNPTGTITIPLLVGISKPTDTSRYEGTLPTTPIPEDIDLAYFQTPVALQVAAPANIPDTSLLEPLLLSRAQVGSDYEADVSLGGIESTSGFEIIDARFLTEACSVFFSFVKEEKKILGSIPTGNELSGCYFQLTVRYLLKLSYGQVEVTSLRTYAIPILGDFESFTIEPTVIEVPIPAESTDVNQSIKILNALEELRETTAEFTPLGNEASLIRGVAGLSIIFDTLGQQIVINGSSVGFRAEETRYLEAIRRDTGQVVLYKLHLVPTVQEEIVLTITQDFPNLIDIPTILKEQGLNDAEIATAKVIPDGLSVSADVSSDNIMTLFGHAELSDQVFSVIVETQTRTPSPLAEFDEQLRGDEDTVALPSTLRIDFRLRLQEPRSLTVEPLKLSANKTVTIDVRQFAGADHSIATPQLPIFLTRSGYQLTGTTPSEAQELNILIQDFTDVVNIVVPLQIVTNEAEVPTPLPPETAEGELRGAAEDTACFPDLDGQPVEYREAICLAKKHGIIAGSGGLFRPIDQINRAEVSKILVTGPMVLFNVLGANEVDNLSQAFTEQRFSDVPRSAWYFGFVETVKEAQIVDGYPDGSFRPGDSLNRAEAAKMIVNIVRQLQPSSFGPQEALGINTRPGDPWFAPFVRILNANGGDLPEVEQSGELAFPISRAEFIYNLLIFIDSKASSILSEQGSN